MGNGEQDAAAHDRSREKGNDLYAPWSPANTPLYSFYVVHGEMMDEIEEFMQDCYDSSRWYHDRSDEQRRFDGIVMAEIAKGRKIGTALKKAACQVPEMATFVATKSIPEFKDYYSRLRRMEQEIAIANNMRMAAAMRKRKAQQG